MNKCLLLVLLLFSSGVSAQINIDSLWSIWHDHNEPDSARVFALKDLIEKGYLFSNPDTAFILGQDMYELAEINGFEKWKATALNYQGISCAIRGRHDEAIRRFTHCLEVNEAIGNQHRVASSLNNIALVYEEIEEHEKALEYFEKSKVIYEEIDDHYGLSIAYGSSASMANRLELFDEAIEWAELAKSYALELGNTPQVAKMYHEIAKALSGQSEEAKDDAIVHALQDSALANFARSLELKLQIGDREGEANTLVANASLLKRLGRTEEATAMAEDALKIAKEVGSPSAIAASAGFLSEEYREAADFAGALEMKDLSIKMRDSIRSERNEREILRQEYKYNYQKQALTDSLQYSKREAVLYEQSEKQQIGLLSAGIVLLLVIVLAFAVWSGKKKSDGLLLNILPYETAQELKKKGSAEAKLIDQVSVIFTDFKGFTALSEKLTPKELVEDLNKCFSAFDQVVEKYGIEKIKTIGDSYMAAGGLPSPSKTHAQDVVNAALEMAQIVEEGKAKKVAAGLPFFEIRIGVHTGPVVAGIVGIKKFQYDIWGDTVNTASRMESSGAVGQVNISQTTYEQLKDEATYAFESRGKIAAKGKGEIEMWFVTRA